VRDGSQDGIVRIGDVDAVVSSASHDGTLPLGDLVAHGSLAGTASGSSPPLPSGAAP
jgi:hypothetical protein